MSASRITETCSASRTLLGAVALLLVPGTSSPADGVITVNESVFNEFADAIGSLSFSGRRSFSVAGITICNSQFDATLSDLAFSIKPTEVIADGEVTANWCGLSFGAPGPEMNAIGDIFYDANAQGVRFDFDSATVNVNFHIDVWVWSGTVTVTTIDITDMLNDIPTLPVSSNLISFDVGGDTREVLMNPFNVNLEKKAGFIELSSDVSLH